MALTNVLKKAGINFEEVGTDEIKGNTPKGKPFKMHRASYAHGLMFTLQIEGMNTAPVCQIHTVINKIKKN